MAQEKKPKWYVVLKGRKPGIYDNWEDAKIQVQGFAAPVFKSFPSLKEAELVWKKGALPPASAKTESSKKPAAKRIPLPEGPYVVVDAACSGVPGPTEYQGFLMPEKRKLFCIEVGWATNNIGEFLAIVHALSLLKKNGSSLPVFSDSATAISWIRLKKVKSNLIRDRRTEPAWRLVDRALAWLNQNQWSNKLLKWETPYWGENPADFGRK
jgi:ribonuclease HI